MFPLITHEEDVMPHAIIRGANGRRHEVDFGNGPLRVEIHPREETVEIYVEADFETLPEERRRFALLKIPRHLFSEATAAAARRAANPRSASSTAERFRTPADSWPRGFVFREFPRRRACDQSFMTLIGPPKTAPRPSETGPWNRWIVSSTRSRR